MSEQLKRGSPNPVPSGGKTQRLARLRVELEIEGLCMRHGVEKIGFLTFTFKDDVNTIAEAQRRFNSLNSGALSGRYKEWLSVVQRHADNRIHFHLVVAMKQNIRKGFDFEAVKKRDYSSASPYLKAEWAYLRSIMPEYSFGRHELLPIRIIEGFGRYVARYVGRTGNTRQNEKGARLVRFSKGFQRVVCGTFSSFDSIGQRARGRLPIIRQELGWRSQAALEFELGPRWKYHLARVMYCSEAEHWQVLFWARHDLELYGGRMMALHEAFQRWEDEKPSRDAIAAALKQQQCLELLFEGAGVESTPERPLAVARNLKPGELFLSRS